MRSNFGMLQSNVLINLFKSYCSFYGSHLWKFNSTGFDKCCKAWNIAIRTLLELPYNADVYLLGPLVKQINIGEQFYVRNYRFFMERISFKKSHCFYLHENGISEFKYLYWL